jgi:DNA-directed RNA polymerase subunit RPC12/RpoP
MVEIVEQGKGKKVTCGECGSVLRYMPNEVITVYRGANYGGDTPEPHAAIKCPSCEKTVLLK